MPPLDVHAMFDRVSHLYDTGWLQRALYLALQDRALAELRLLRPTTVVDVGCGTGIFAERLSRELAPAAVAGCDMSAGMLGQAAARTRGVGWVRGDSARLPFRRGALDAVVCTQAFHFFDQPAAWAEFRRVLVPGGHAMVGMLNPKTAQGSRRFARLGARTAATPVSFPTAPDLRRLATDAGFEVTAQIEVDWRFRRVVPVVLTVGRAPAA
jgi:ubiquinone/menaquinone biosynthesis C-methylase UbiE